MAKPSATTTTTATSSPSAGIIAKIPLLYRLFFLYIEPVATLLGGYYAFFGQDDYLNMTHPSLATAAVSVRESTVLSQLANMYAVFALNEALVLRCTSDLRVWRTFLLGLLLADLGHIAACRTPDLSIYWDVPSWNAMWWGNLGFVYVGATFRTLFLLGLGLPGKTD